MARPFFRPMEAEAPANTIPRAMGTALFLHRIKTQMASKPTKADANGHPVIHQPIVVRPRRPTHTTSTQLY